MKYEGGAPQHGQVGGRGEGALIHAILQPKFAQQVRRALDEPGEAHQLCNRRPLCLRAATAGYTGGPCRVEMQLDEATTIHLPATASLATA